MNDILQILPATIKEMVHNLPEEMKNNVEEIRLRIDRPLEVIAYGKPYYPLVKNERYIVTKEDGRFFLNQLSQYSLYAFEEELKQGYITVRGGHRVGLAGRVIMENGKVKGIREISSYNIRIARQKIGIAAKLIPHIYENGWQNTLIIGPPQSGKTTLLRDIARMISEGVKEKNIPPQKVGIVDERSEIAASVRGIPQHSLGDRVDVLDGCPKAEGMMMMIRSMSPDVIIVDEIGRPEDAQAVKEALCAGVKIVTTVHGFDFEDVANRPTVKDLLLYEAFSRTVELTRKDGFVGIVKKIRHHGQKDVVRIV